MDKISQKKKIVERKNIAKTTKTKYAITKFWWWNLKIKFETILEWENLSGEKHLWGKKIFEWKKMGNQNHFKFLTKSSLVHPCTISKFVLYS